MTFGQWVENKLNERDDKGKPKHRIEKLLLSDEQKKKQTVNVARLASIPGVLVK